ncbi:MAG: LapA family protein [Hydrogenophilus thermoluteolus]|jgi:uncharacterized membrane protein YciS (DUF1049 family)|uniref:LapA family protein n=1 Tax=Hydrogenophilus thiooxidans TaxID=2820326 RepID=UPI000ED73477|nr:MULTISPECIES: LapA family protein [Hydrogenophilus]MBW7656263.1 LapA family protein [Hydrogenophilus thermoluteolus]HCO77560.1 hypothetical protein [Rhodocyclaceae bacterium]HNQ48261.1 LapA family protein [Hydrogenophilus thermoluteolus]HNU20514.1 LapA family protein [Hydrogenophilus thermoluteolus]
MKRLIILVLFVVVFAVVGALAFRNHHNVFFHALIWQGEVPLVWLLVGAFALGVVLTLLLFFPAALRQRWQLWRARREVARLSRQQLMTPETH